MFVKTLQMHLKQFWQVFKNDWPVENTKLKSQVGSDKSFREGNQSGAALPTAAAAFLTNIFSI